MKATARPNNGNDAIKDHPNDGRDEFPSGPTSYNSATLAHGVERARDYLISQQKEDGHWCAELEGDTILESEYILMLAILGRWSDPRVGKCARYLLDQQNDEGGWGNYPGGASDVGVTVKAYFALKIAGYDAEHPALVRARQVVLNLGGAETVNSFTRFYLAALGQIPYSHCASVPPELVLLPRWFPINLYAMSSWTRTIVVPLSIVYAHRPNTRLPQRMWITELFIQPPREGRLPEVSKLQGRLISWPNFFRVLDRGVKLYEKFFPKFVRKVAIKAAEKWMVEHFEGSDGVGAIFPPMVYTVLALRCLGYAEDSPEVLYAHKQLDDLMIEERDAIRIQPCVSPVWDTTWAMVALGDSGLDPDHPSLTKSADWLLAREVRRLGDWAYNNPGIEPSGWVFEYNNDFYPDVDDTATALMAVKRTSRYNEEPCRKAVHRAISWMLSMQCKDHGWAAFDKDINNKILEAIPFADHNAMLDPSCPDITARVIEMLGQLGYQRGKPFIDQAIEFILAHQEPEGCWFGRWGVNYLYGTWQVLVGLASIGFPMNDPRVRKAVDWLLSVEQPGGGWGESCTSYAERDTMGQGPVTASQTAWALLGLIAAGEADHPAVQRGIQYLLDTQNADGSWDEPYFTGTGFPKVFYLRYHYYRLYFPLMALAKFTSAQAPSEAAAANTAT